MFAVRKPKIFTSCLILKLLFLIGVPFFALFTAFCVFETCPWDIPLLSKDTPQQN